MIRVVVDNRVRIPTEDLVGCELVADSIRAAFTHPNPEHRNDPKNEPAFERTWREEGGWLSVPRGGLARVRRALTGQDFQTFDRREAGRPMQLPHTRELWPHQERIVEAIEQRQNCLVRSGTGTGKTSAALAAACRLGRWTLAVVWTKGLMKQWVERVVEECGIPERDIGIIQGRTRTFRPITVAMQQTLAQKPLTAAEAAQFGTVVADEVQFFAAKTFFATADPFPAKYRVGISANETRADGRQYLIYDLFGEVAVEFTTEEAVEAGVVHDVQIAVVPTHWDPGGWYQQARSAGNVFRMRWAHKKMQDHLAADVPRAQLAADFAAREAREGRTVALLTERREHCNVLAAEVLRRGFVAGMMVGGAENEREFDDAKRKVKAGSLRVVVGTVKAIGTGIDVPAFDRGVVCSHLTNNEQLFGQVRGRFCRTGVGKDDARIYVLWDEAVQGRKAIDNLIRWNQDVVVLDDDRWIAGADFRARHRAQGTNIRRRTA